jgi:hypothetical protein
VRFWGWTENSREFEKDFKELTQRTREGKSLYGESGDPEFVQVAAHRNSQWSQLKFCKPGSASTAIELLTRLLQQWCHGMFHVPDANAIIHHEHRFNLVNHPYHGVDPAKYGPNAFLVGPDRTPSQQE